MDDINWWQMLDHDKEIEDEFDDDADNDELDDDSDGEEEGEENEEDWIWLLHVTHLSFHCTLFYLLSMWSHAQ